MSEPEKKHKPQANNPLHGVKLLDMLERLVDDFGWEEMAFRINIRCFKNDPSIKSSLKFLRTTPWARDKVEQLYLHSVQLEKWATGDELKRPRGQ